MHEDYRAAAAASAPSVQTGVYDRPAGLGSASHYIASRYRTIITPARCKWIPFDAVIRYGLSSVSPCPHRKVQSFPRSGRLGSTPRAWRTYSPSASMRSIFQLPAKIL